MARKAAIEVAQRGERWSRHKAGLQPSGALHLSEQEAILAARQDAKRAGTELVVKGADGRIRQVDRFSRRTAR